MFCTLGCALYGIWVWEDLFKKCHLKKYQKIYLSGDTGSGFRSYLTATYYSFMKDVHGVEVEVHHLCPRHAFNICDPAGGRYSEGGGTSFFFFFFFCAQIVHKIVNKKMLILLFSFFVLGFWVQFIRRC